MFPGWFLIGLPRPNSISLGVGVSTTVVKFCKEAVVADEHMLVVVLMLATVVAPDVAGCDNDVNEMVSCTL